MLRGMGERLLALANGRKGVGLASGLWPLLLTLPGNATETTILNRWFCTSQSVTLLVLDEG